MAKAVRLITQLFGRYEKSGMTHYVSLLGLGFGDCGKGLFTDFLARHWQAHTVVRFNGGAQAGHNVMLPDGRHHTFSQFGSASFQSGVTTVLAAPVVLHPGALLVENRLLLENGVPDPLQRLLIDGRCRVNTPFHQAAGRLRELQRGSAAHGTCGVGVGETVAHALAWPEQMLCYADLFRPKLALAKLDAIRQTLLAEFGADCAVPDNAAQYRTERQMLLDSAISARWLLQIGELMRSVPPSGRETLRAHLQQPGTVLFEGAQGVLLDEWRGFHPHTTWSTIHPNAVRGVLQELGITGSARHFGILRSYHTRHGQGPLPTQDSALDVLTEPHNHGASWQGQFRRGHFDAVLLRYALDVCGPLDGLLISHLDAFRRLPGIRYCHAYSLNSTAHSSEADASNSPLCQRNADGLISALRPGSYQDLSHQSALANLLTQVLPCYHPAPLMHPNDLLAKLADLTDCPVILGSFGPAHENVKILAPALLTGLVA